MIFVDRIPAAIAVLACPLVLAACGLSIETLNLTPVQSATFVTTDVRVCDRFPGSLVTGAIVPPPFLGLAPTIGVGYEGVYHVRNQQAVNYMNGVVRFDLSSIPPDKGRVTAAYLSFQADPSDRHRYYPRCEVISGVERVTTPWGEDSDFRTHMTSVPDPRVRMLRADRSYEYDVSAIVQQWLISPDEKPNRGFVVRPSTVAVSACDVSLGEPGNRLDCYAGLHNFRLVVQYVTAP